MIEALALALINQQPIEVKRREDRIVIVGQKATATTVKGVEDFISQFYPVNASVTYQNNPVVENGEEEIEIGKPIKSFSVTAPVVFLGKGTQPPIDDDEFVYFDE